MNANPKTPGLKLASSVFSEGASIPIQYSCKGSNINPPLQLLQAPAGTQSFALVMHDPDAVGSDFLHWLLWDIPPSIDHIQPNSVPVGAIQGRNGTGRLGYTGPCPPAGTGTHRYMFELYALDQMLNLDHSSSRQDVERALEGHVLGKNTLNGVVDAQPA